MPPSVFHSNKAVYPILTTFSFIIVVLFVVMGLVYYGSYVLNVKSVSKAELNKYESIQDVKDRLFYCYGQVYDKAKLGTDCNIRKELIAGYIVEELSYRNCTYSNWTYDYGISKSLITENYLITIQDQGFICPGRVKVFV